MATVISPELLWIIVILVVWEMIWKGIALWKTGKNQQIAWFVCIFIINTVGILPIIYLLFFQKRKTLITKSKKR
ncbi:hypothetical protein J4411_03825 [Candidatus Pacearchaeota archaeon]|nr:hypothetical protein [Candidatus Pacearchaeota archaeon]